MANTKFQFKRTTVTGRTPNTSDPANTSYIAPGEFALNLADGKLFTSNGDLITIGSNQTEINADQGNFNNISTDGGIAIGNSTVNASINATALFAGNGSVNVVVNTTILTVSNTVSNVSVSPLKIFVGNSTVNTTIDLSGGSSNVAISRATITAAGVVTVNTSTNHGISATTQSYVKITDSSVFILNSANYSTGDLTFKLSEVSSANSIKFTINSIILNNLTNKNRKISSIQRTNGAVVVTTIGDHNLINGDTVAISDTISGTTVDMKTTGSVITKINDTSFSYVNGRADITFNLNTLGYSIAAKTASSSGDIDMTITKASHGLLTNDSFILSGASPSTISLADKYNLPLNAKFSVKSRTTDTFTFKIGTKTRNVGSWSTTVGSFTAGSLTFSQNETGSTSGSVYQVITNSSVGGNVAVEIPKGILIRDVNGDKLMRITAEGVYVGNTTLGGFTGATGFKAQKP